jgi:ankyrin repeat protein
VWQQSQGSFEALRKYIDTRSGHTYTPGDLDKMLEQAKHQRVMLISDTAGMGKSTVLTHLSKQIKQKFPAKWVVRIDLNDHTDALDALQGEEIDKEKAIQFLSEKMLKLESDLEIELFKQSCGQKQKLNAVIMLDAFDKISPSYKETVIDLLQALRQTAVEQLWVTTRPHLREELEDKLQQLSYTLEPFSEENQVDFLTKFWSRKDCFTEMMKKEEKKVQLEIYAKHLIMQIAQSVRYNDKEFIGIPLQCRMLAEAFDEDVKTFYETAASMSELRFKQDMLGLHRSFMERKKGICVEETFKISGTNVGAQLAQRQYLKKVTDDHQMLALKTLFGEEQVALLQINSQCTSSEEELIRAGMVQVSHDGKLHFIQLTFAEYYVAEFLVNQLTKISNTSQQVQDLLLHKIFVEDDYRVVRGFIDGLLPSAKPSKEVLKQYGNRISVFRRDGALILHQAAREGNANISGFLLESVLAGGHTDTVHEMLLAQDNDRYTAWHLAAMGGHTAALEKLWECANEKLTKVELVKELLLNRDNWGQTAWHYASLRGYVEVLQKLWKWGKETLTAEDLYDKLFLAKDNKERTAWHLAAKNGNPEILQNLWEWGKEKLTGEELNSKLLLAKDNTGRSAWHLAAKNGNLEVLQKMWECGKGIRTGQDLNNKLLFAKDHWGQTAWHFASLRGNVEVLQKLWEWGKETLTAGELNNKLLVAKDNWGQTAWNYASLRDNADTLRKLWTCRKEILTAEEQKDKLLFAKDNKKESAWQLAAMVTNTEV